MAQSTSPARGTGDAWGTFLQQQQQPTGPENFSLLTAQIALLLESVNKLTKKNAELDEKGPTQAGPQAAASGPGGQEAPVQLPKAQPATDSFQEPNGDPWKAV